MSAPFRVLVFSKTAAYRHESIPAAIAMFQRLAEASQKATTDASGAPAAASAFAIDTSEDAEACFTPAALAAYRVVVLLNCTGDFLDAAQLAALQAYVGSGRGGVVGIHNATGAMTSRAIDPDGWYGRLLGAVFTEHPAPQLGRLIIKDRKHPIVAALLAGVSATEASAVHPSYSCFDEYYNFEPDSPAILAAGGSSKQVNGINGVNGVNGTSGISVISGLDSMIDSVTDAAADSGPQDIHILLAADEETYTGGKHGDHHPIAWCQDFEGTGTRVFYTALGHFDAAYEDDAFAAHLRDAVLWTAKML